MRKNKIYFSYFLLLAIFIESIFFMSAKTGKSLYLVLYIVLALACITIVFFTRFDRVAMKEIGALRAVVLFIICYLIVHFQVYLDVVLGICPTDIAFEKVSLLSVKKSAVLSLIGLQSFILAYINTPYRAPRDSSTSLSRIHVPLLMLKILTFLSLLWLLYCGRGFYFSMSYGSVDLVGTRLSYALQIFTLLMNSTLILCMKDYQKETRMTFWGFLNKMGWLFNFTVALFIVATFSSGDRGPALFAIIGYLVAYCVISHRSLKYSQFLLLLVIGAVFLSLLGIVRRSGTFDNMSGQVNEAYFGMKDRPSLIPATSELAGSVRTLHTAVDLVPDQFPHTNGIFQLTYIVETIPFYSRFFPSLGASLGFNRSTAFLTWAINGDLDSSGVGTTCIADSYIDLGLLGVIIIMLIWGWILKYSEVLFMAPISSLSVFRATLSFVAVSSAIYIARSAVLFSLKDVIWLFLFLGITVIFSPSRQ